MIEYDPHDPAQLTDGVDFEHLARVRREAPVCPTPGGAYYLATRELVEEALKDVDTYRADLSLMSGLKSLDEVPVEELFLSEIVEPRHGQIRRLFNATFGPHKMAAYEPEIAAICHRLCDAMAASEVVDLHLDYALPIPGLVMAHLMGLPDDAPERFMTWSMDGTIMQRPCSPAIGADGHPLQQMFAEQLAARRAMPEMPDDVFRRLSEAEVEGERLTDQEIVTQLHFMVQAGVHTTRGLLTHLVHRLLIDPSLWERLAADRELVGVFVEESLRFDAPVQRTTRHCTRDTTIGGVAVRAGEWLEMGIASANRDEAVYGDPETFSLDRPQPRDHIAFGAGSHVCPGATLARMEGTIAVQVLLDRFTAMTPVEGVRYPPLPGNLGHEPIPARLKAVT